MTRRIAASLSLTLVACASAPEATSPEPVTSATTDIEISVKESEPRPALTAAIAPVTPQPPSICEQYFAKLEACNRTALASVPQGPSLDAAYKAMNDAITATREAFATLDHETLDNVCKTVIESLSQNPNCPK
jgi:hypothetical protein